MNCSRWATAAFIVSADCSTNGSCISPDAEQVADDLHAGEQVVVDDGERRDALGPGLVEVGDEAVAVAVDDALLQALGDRPAGAVLLLDLVHRLDVLEQLEDLRQRVVVVASLGQGAGGAAAVVDEVEAGVALLVGDPVRAA